MGNSGNNDKYSQSSDVIIIGGGIIGSSIGLELRRHNLSVTILEKNNQPGLEASSAAFGTLPVRAYPIMDIAHYNLLKESVSIYPGWLNEIAEIAGVNLLLESKKCILISLEESDVESLDILYKFLKEKGINAEYLTPEQIKKLEPNINSKAIRGLLLSDDLQISNMVKLTQSVCKVAEIKGCKFILNSQVIKLIYKKRKLIGVKTKNSTFYGKKIIISAGCWSGTIEGAPILPITPIRCQGIMVDAPGLVQNRVISSNGYIAPRADGKTILGIVEESVGFKSNPTAGAAQEILHGSIDLVPMLKHSEIVRIWAGNKPSTPDALPVLGSPKDSPNLIYATGHLIGMMLAPITAKLIAELIIRGNKETLKKLQPFSPDRFIK